MKLKAKYILILIALLDVLISGCENKDLNDEINERIYSFDTLDLLNVKNDIHVILIQDSLNYILISAPEEMQPDLSPIMEEDDIILENRSRNKIFNRYNQRVEAELHFSDFRYLFYQGAGDITSNDTIRMERFQIASNGATGTIDLWVDIKGISMGLSTGTLDVILRGKADAVSVWSTSYTKLDLLELDAKKVNIRNNSPSDNYVKALESLNAKVQSIGNIFYSGEPSTINLEETGSGKLIKLD